MKKIFFASLALSLAFAGAAAASDFNAAFRGGVAGSAISGTFGSSFARGAQAGGGASFSKTENGANAGAEIQGGTNLPLRVNGFVNSGSQSSTGSLTNGNGSASASTGGVAGGFAGVGAAGAVGFRR